MHIYRISLLMRFVFIFVHALDINGHCRNPHAALSCKMVSRRSREEGKDQELIQSSTILTQNTIWESDKTLKTQHKREPRGNHKAARNRQDSITKRT